MNLDSEPAPTQEALALVLDEIKKINRSVISMRGMINELVSSHHDLKDEVDSLRQQHNNSSSAPPRVHNHVLHALQAREIFDAVKMNTKSSTTKRLPLPTHHPNHIPTLRQNALASEAAAAITKIPNTPLDPKLATTDEEVDAIIASRRQNNTWPVRYQPNKKFTHDPDLLKLRFHHSLKHQHMPVFLPKTPKPDQNGKFKTNKRKCRLCQRLKDDGKVYRCTTWMCSTCQIPLCIKTLPSEPSTESHFVKWHSVLNLEEESARCSEALRRSMEIWSRERAKKRAREEEEDQDNYEEEEEEDEEATLNVEESSI
ncbi:hypothetical protein HJC23_004132 [Cyclotella cryptica]|uniref:PiggyBac transposable element-derived protein 4 C-terminal zinc-ribbon domain-containing protein n=1 Tax=Cyclotella cryptica TaxID=29204 RepID=A0ABD3PGT5_9STRA|eukprot:CCRYP_014674-RA/>CCRYP_014674-RA protein AED:0.06 eAED:0.06 QI:181/1/1/1/0/0/2/227/313